MINVIGLGYIGLPTALMMASNGIEVIGTDYNKDLVKTLNEGKLTFSEDGLDSIFESAIEAGIKFTTNYQKTDIYIVSVPTPFDENSKKVDAKYVVAAVKRVLEVALSEAILIIESTIPPGTIDQHIRPLLKEYNRTDVRLSHAPERIIPGNMIYELRHNNRTIGADDKETCETVKKLYAHFCQGEIDVTDIRTAEMTKVIENAYRDVNIAYANELAKICHAGGMDVNEIIRIANKHPRVNILSPGPGVGGHCISVDPWFLVGDYPGLANLILTARHVNDSMPEFVLSRAYEIMNERAMTDVGRVGIYGLTYKENVDDTRESPTLQLLSSMKRHLTGNLVKVYDPYIKHDMVINQMHDLDEFLGSIDFVIIMVAHKEIVDNQPKLKDKVILDTRKCCNIEGTYRL